MSSVVRELWPDPERASVSQQRSTASASSGNAASLSCSHSRSGGSGDSDSGAASGSDGTIRDPAAGSDATGVWPSAGLFKALRIDGAGDGALAGAAGGTVRPGQLLEPSPCPLSPTRPRALRSPSRRKAGGSGGRMGTGAGGNLTALAATLTGLGVQLDRPQPDALKPSVADIAAGINRTVNALARIAGQLSDTHPRGPPSAPGSPSAASSAAGPGSPTRGRAAFAGQLAGANAPEPWLQPRRVSQHQPDVGAPLDRGPRRSPADPLKGAATHEQLQQLRAELDRLNSTVLRARQSGGAVALGASGGRQPISAAASATSPGMPPGSEGAIVTTAAAGSTTVERSLQPALSPARQCHQMVHEATKQLQVLQAENRELRTHLGEAEHTVSDLRRQLINLQVAIDRTGGTDTGALLLQNQKLQRALHAKEATAAAAQAALAAQGPAAADERVAELSARLQEVKVQLRARDAALLASEARLRELRWLEEKEKERAASDEANISAAVADEEAAAAVASLQRERQRVASLEAAIEGYRSELAAREDEVHALRSQVLLLKQQQTAAAASVAPVGVPALEDALQQLARRAEEAAALRADARHAEAERAAALAEQAAEFGARLEAQQRALDVAQAQVQASTNKASELRQQLEQAAVEKQRLQAELEAAVATSQQHDSPPVQAEDPHATTVTASAAAAEGDLAGQVQGLRRMVNDRTDEIDRLRGFLAQVYDTARCAAPSAVSSTTPSPRGSSDSAGGMDLAVRVQHGVQQLVARLGEQQAEVARLREAARAEWMERRFPGQPAPPGFAALISSGSGQIAADQLTLQQPLTAEHPESETATATALTMARDRIAVLERQGAELEDANAACMSELEQAAARLAASEQQLLAMVALQRAHEELRARATELQSRAEAAASDAAAQSALRAKAEAVAAEAAADVVELRAQLAQAEAAVIAAQEAQRAAADAAAQRAVDVEALINAAPNGPERERVDALKERCGELEQQLVRLRAQLSEADAQGSRLHAANAALQERLSSALQAEGSGSQRGSVTGGGDDVRALRGRCQELEHLVSALEKQLIEQQQQTPRDLDARGGGDQPASLSRQGSQQAAWLRQLSARSAPGAEVEVEVTLPGGAPTAAALRRRCDQLAAQVSALQQQSEARAVQLKRSEDRARESEAAARAAASLRTQVIALRRERDALAAELEERSSELQQWQVHAQALEEDLEQLRSEAAATEAGGGSAASEAEARARETGEQLAAKEAALEAARAELQGARDTIAYLQDAISSNAQDYQALLARHQQAEAGLARSQEAAADMRARLEAITGPAGPQARLRQLEAQLAQMHRKLEAAESTAHDAHTQRAAAASEAAARGEEVIALEGQLAVVTQELEATRGTLEALQQRTPRASALSAATTPRTPVGGATVMERSAAATAGGAAVAVAASPLMRGAASGRRRPRGAA